MTRRLPARPGLGRRFVLSACLGTLFACGGGGGTDEEAPVDAATAAGAELPIEIEVEHPVDTPDEALGAAAKSAPPEETSAPPTP